MMWDTESVLFYFSAEAISDVLTVKQIIAKAQESSDAFYGIIYGFITALGLDSSISRVICSRW